jgi:CheY-like chemotaxis protein
MALAPQGRKVLVVEDEAIVSMLIEDMLQELGHNVVATAARLDEALDLARVSEVDLAILDVNLGGRTSHAVADLLKSRRIPFLFASGYDASALGPAYQGAPVVQKPFQIGELTAAIERALAQYATK